MVIVFTELIKRLIIKFFIIHDLSDCFLFLLNSLIKRRQLGLNFSLEIYAMDKLSSDYGTHVLFQRYLEEGMTIAINEVKVGVHDHIANRG
jgi:hypothetical protein